MITEPIFNKNIIKEKSDNINFEINIPIFKKTVLKNNKPYEGSGNAYYKIIKNNNNYKLFYRGINKEIWNNNIKIDTHKITNSEQLCLAESNDGLNFNKKICLSQQIKNKFMKTNNFCHNFFPFFDEKKIYIKLFLVQEYIIKEYFYLIQQEVIIG